MKNHASQTKKTTKTTTSQNTRRLAATMAAGALAMLATPAHAEDRGAAPAASSPEAARCFPVQGKFEVQALPDDQCQSPAGRCTIGHFTGRLHGDYSFTLESLVPTPVPNIFFYAGMSQLVLPDGTTLTGTETATIDFDPARFGYFATTITVDDAGGQLVLSGRLDFAGGGQGTYQGHVCPAG